MYVSCKPRLQFCQIEAMFMVNSMLVELQLSKCFPITEIASKKAITRSRGISCHVIEQLAVVIELQSRVSCVLQKMRLFRSLSLSYQKKDLWAKTRQSFLLA